MKSIRDVCMRAVVVLSSAFLAAVVPLTAQPKITMADGSTSMAFWFLGPGQSGGTGVVPNGYITAIGLQATYPADQNPTPTVTWSTNQPSLIALVPYLFVERTSFEIVQATGPSYTTPQSPPGVYNINVVVTWDGVRSAPFPIFINMPYSNTVINQGQYCSAFNRCDCNASGFPYGDTGYVTLNNVYTRDLFGNAITTVATNEVLFNQLWLGYGGWTSPPISNPSQSSWPPAAWTSQYVFPDYFWICSGDPAAFSPPPTSSGSGGAAVFSETQDYWIGVATNGQGVCTQASAVTLYTNNGAQSNLNTPGYPATICNNKSVFNSHP